MGMANVDGKDYIVDKVGRVNRDIEWKEGAVCFADGQQWFTSEEIYLTSDCSLYSYNYENIINCDDFQLNEPRQGDYIPKSELDTEQKYNDAVEVFGLFGIKAFNLGRQSFERLQRESFWCLGVDSDNSFAAKNKSYKGVRKISLKQLMAIGKLKRLMDDRNKQVKVDEFLKAVSDDVAETARKMKPVFFDLASNHETVSKHLTYADAIKNYSAKPKRRNKSKQAYEILESLDYEYDLVKQCWYRKEYIK